MPIFLAPASSIWWYNGLYSVPGTPEQNSPVPETPLNVSLVPLTALSDTLEPSCILTDYKRFIGVNGVSI